jgi:hypothetical protein
MITSFNIHDVTEVKATQREHGTTQWTDFAFVGANGTILTVAAFATEGYVGCTYEGQFDADISDVDEPNEAEPRITLDALAAQHQHYEPIGYRADMVNAGRGHLLGE